MPKVTIIMPSLNVVKYIRVCMESVLAQTLRDIEILTIDAGSDDGTFEILQEYAAADKRIKIIHSDKKSYGYQLNIGISLAQGEYVGVVETDDKIAPDMFQVLYEKAVETGADYVKGCAQSFIEVTQEIVISNRILCISPMNEMDKMISPRQCPKLFVTDRFLWLGIYRCDFVKKIKLNETLGAAFQDIGFMFQAICNADRAVYLDKDVYFYRQDNEGASSHDVRGFRYLVEEYTYVEQFLEGKDQEWYQVYYEKMLNQCLGRFQMMSASGVFWKEAVSDIKILQENLLKAVENKILRLDKMTGGTRKFLNLFLEDVENVYSYYVNELEQKKKIVCDIMKVIKHRSVIIFGCGTIGKFLHALLESKFSGIVMAYCDNYSELWNTKTQGLPVFAPKTVVHCYPDAAYVVTGRKSAEAMRQQLKQMGVKDDHIYFFQERVDMMLFQMR